ncbi:MAG: methyltransferase, partial [Mycobacteriales bacterium]
ANGTVRATRLTRTLRSNDVHAVGAWCRYLSSAAHQMAWGDLATSVRTGEPAFRRVHEQSLFDWFASHGDEGDQFTHGLAGLTLADAPFVLAAMDLPSEGVVCDIAGGRGVLLAEVLTVRPGLRGVLIESTSVLAEARTYLGERGLLERTELVEGDMFADIDVTADLYLLKWILHDWDDATCQRLLKGVAAAMPTGARLAVIEGLQEPNVVDARLSMIDLEMLVVTEGGRERSGDDLRGLLAAASLSLEDLRITATGTAVLTARR